MRATSPPELTGGAGFTFEGAVSAFYLTHLLAETAAPGDADRIVARVAFGQRGFGEPLDDLVVDLAGLGASARLSLQVKRSLIISRAKSNSDFRAVIRACWETLIKGDFRRGLDRYGVVVGEVAASRARALQTLCELARESSTKENFEARFTPGGNAGSSVLTVKHDIETLLAEMEGAHAAAHIHQFLAHLILIRLDFLHEGACDPPQAVNRIRDCLVTEDVEKAPLVWSRLIQISRESAGRSGEIDRVRLLRTIAPLARLRRADVSMLVDVRRTFLLSMREHCEQLPQVDPTSRLGDAYVSLSLDRCDGGEERRAAHRISGKMAENALTQSGNHLIEGVAGSGKSTLARRLVIACADALLERSSASFETARLPALVQARTIVENRGSFSDAVRRAVVEDIAFTGVAEPPAGFFDPSAQDGHASWLLIVDGLDEIIDGAQRQKLWNSLARHAQTSECFRFIVTSRPGAIDVRDGSTFARWSAAPLEAASWRAIAGRRLNDEKMLGRFVERMDRPDHAEIVRLPLFITMAADVFRRHPDLPTLSSDLCDLFARHMLNRMPAGNVEARSAVERLLEVCAVDAAPNFLLLAESEPQLLDAFGPSSLLPLEFEVEARRTLAKCGLGRFVGSEFRFNHDLLRSRFAARAISRTSKPSERVWDTIDPFKAGWAVVEQICISWDRAGEEISPTVRGLLSYGEDGLKCAVGVMGACPSVGDREVGEVTERLIRSMEFGPMTWVLDALAGIARGRPLVKKRLLDVINGYDDWIGHVEVVEIIECLLKAGYRDDAVRALKRLCRLKDCYGPDRIQAAELLLQCNEQEIAVAALTHEMEDGEEPQWRLDAACALLEAEPSLRTRQAVRDLLEETENAGETAYEATLGRLLKLGEEDLALAALRQMARPEAKGLDRDVPWTAIRASRELAVWDRDEGIRALAALLAHEDYSLRGRAEVIEALYELGEVALALDAMRRALASADDEQIDWFVVDVMRTLDMRDEAALLGKRAIGQRLREGDSWRNWKDLFDHLYGWCDLTDLLDPLTRKLEAEPSTNVAGALARLGCRDAAITTLRSWCSHWDPRKVLDAAGALAELGSRDQALRTANRIAKDASIAPEHRLSAAETLRSVGMFPQSARLYTLLLRENSLGMKWRCRAANALSESGRSTRAIWNTLWDYLLDEGNELRDRVVAAEQLLKTEEDEFFDYNRYDVYDILLDMLDDANLAALEKLKIGKILARRRLNLSELSAVLPALEPCAAPTAQVLSFLSEVSVFARDPAADLKALEIVERDAPPWRIVIDTCSHIHTPDAQSVAQARLEKLATDPMAPPAWRRNAAEALHRTDPGLGAKALKNITADASISVRERHLALKKFAASDRHTLWEGLLDLSRTPDLSFWERMTLVELAVEIAALDQARDFLDAARLDAPLSINEVAALAKRYLDIGAEDSASELLNELISLPKTILAATEDTYELIEAARLFVKMGRESDAAMLLVTLLDQGHACSYETPKILHALATVATPADLRIVIDRCEMALAQELDDPDLDYAGAHLELWSCLDELSTGADETLLLQIVLNEKVYMGSRLEACALLIRRNARSASKARAAARGLFKQAVVDNLSEALAHAAAFEQCGLGGEVSELIERSIEDAALNPPGLRKLADILQRRGESGRAEHCLKRARALDPKEPMYFLHQRIIENIEGQERSLELLRERLYDEREDLYERLEYARDLVNGNGDQQAWCLLVDTLRSPSMDVGTRLRAVELLDELELRELPREAANELRRDPNVDDYWIGDFLLRVGRKQDAVASLERAITTCPKDYIQQIAARLADLRADSLLFRLEKAAT